MRDIGTLNVGEYFKFSNKEYEFLGYSYELDKFVCVRTDNKAVELFDLVEVIA